MSHGPGARVTEDCCGSSSNPRYGGRLEVGDPANGFGTFAKCQLDVFEARKKFEKGSLSQQKLKAVEPAIYWKVH